MTDFWAKARAYPLDKEKTYLGHGRAHEFDLARGQDVLEYGCGGGSDTLSLLGYGAHVTYTDIVPSNVEATTALVAKWELGKNATPLVLPASATIPVPDHSFDVVNAHGVLHHIPNPLPVLEEFRRVLREGGRLYVMLYSELYAEHTSGRIDELMRTHRLDKYQAFGWVTDGEGCPYARPYSLVEGRALLAAGGFDYLSDFEYASGYFRTFHAVPTRRKARHSFPAYVFDFTRWEDEDDWRNELSPVEQVTAITEKLFADMWLDANPTSCAVNTPWGLYGVDKERHAFLFGKRAETEQDLLDVTTQGLIHPGPDFGHSYVKRQASHPKIVWIASGRTEAERDVWESGIDVWCHEPRSTLTNNAHRAHCASSHDFYKDAPEDASFAARRAWLQRLAVVHADLYVFRYPYWIYDNGLADVFAELFGEKPVVAWSSEQGPMREGVLRSLAPFHHVAVNNRYDVSWFRTQLPGKQVHYLPFCGVPNVGVVFGGGNKNYDCIADGTPHYACGTACGAALGAPGVKNHSVDVMLRPLLVQANPRLAVWGDPDPFHGWRGVPGVDNSIYQGQYPPEDYKRIYSQGSLYLGISWNWAHGGYGTKLARAMAAGIPVLWHRTPGMELDGLEEGFQLECSSTRYETVWKVDMLLKHAHLRRNLAANAVAFVAEQWSWQKNLYRLWQEL